MTNVYEINVKSIILKISKMKIIVLKSDNILIVLWLCNAFDLR